MPFTFRTWVGKAMPMWLEAGFWALVIGAVALTVVSSTEATMKSEDGLSTQNPPFTVAGMLAIPAAVHERTMSYGACPLIE